MKSAKSFLLFLFIGTAASVSAQSINVTATGVGIGTTTPTGKLSVTGGVMNIDVATPAGGEVLDWPTAGLSIRRFDNYHVMTMLQFGHIGDSTYQTGAATWNFSLVDNVASKTTSDANTALRIVGPGHLAFSPTGNVGIGLNNPSQKLHVVGNSVTTGSATVGSLVVGTSPIFSVGSFESAEQAIPGDNGTITIPHGLGGVPSFTTLSLRCKVAEHGWAVGDEIQLSSIDIISNNHGVTTAVNATNFKLVQYGYLYVHTFGTHAIINITYANWRLVFRAWR